MQTHAWFLSVCNGVLTAACLPPENTVRTLLLKQWFSNFSVHGDHLESLLNH